MIDKIKSFTFFSIAAKICWGLMLLIPIWMGVSQQYYVTVSPRVNNAMWGSVFVLVGIIHALVFINLDMPKIMKIFSYFSLFIWMWLAIEAFRVHPYSTTSGLYGIIAFFDFISALDCKTLSFILHRGNKHDKRITNI